MKGKTELPGPSYELMMNCFCGMVDRRKAFSLIFSWAHCQRFSPLMLILHHCESPTRHEQDLNLRRTLLQAVK